MTTLRPYQPDGEDPAADALLPHDRRHDERYDERQSDPSTVTRRAVGWLDSWSTTVRLLVVIVVLALVLGVSMWLLNAVKLGLGPLRVIRK